MATLRAPQGLAAAGPVAGPDGRDHVCARVGGAYPQLLRVGPPIECMLSKATYNHAWHRPVCTVHT